MTPDSQNLSHVSLKTQPTHQRPIEFSTTAYLRLAIGPHISEPGPLSLPRSSINILEETQTTLVISAYEL